MQPETDTLFTLNSFLRKVRDPRLKNSNIKLEPKVFGCFSLTSERFYSSGTAELKFLVLPDHRTYPLNLNVNPVGDEGEPESQYLDNMFYFIKDHQNQMLSNSHNNIRKVQADVLTHSEVLQTLLCTPYIKRSWRILGSRFHSTIYLCHDEPVMDGTMSSMQLLNQRTSIMSETALKRLLYSDTPDRWTAHSREHGQLYGAFRCNIGNLSVVYGAPMGVYQGKLKKAGENKLNMFAECKVKFSQNPTENNDSKLKSLQALNWCCECSLKGVQDLYIAHAKKPSQIIKLEKTTIPTLIKENVNSWNYDWCINFMLHTLEQFGLIMKLDNPNSVYQFDYDSNTSTLSYSVFRQPSEKTFISDWYRNVVENRNI